MDSWTDNKRFLEVLFGHMLTGGLASEFFDLGWGYLIGGMVGIVVMWAVTSPRPQAD
jgi:hypothetical protein